MCTRVEILLAPLIVVPAVRGSSSRRELALGAQAVRELIGITVREVDKVRALCNLVVTGLAPPRPRRPRAGWLIEVSVVAA